jgi:site-specific DNA-methyltransferase (adenine-specific)
VTRPSHDECGIAIYHGDCRALLPSLDSAGVTHVVTDPPYGTGGRRRDVSGGGSNPKGRLRREEWDDGAVDWLALLPATTRAVATFWPPARTLQLLAAASAAGFTKHRLLALRKPDPKPQVAGRTRWSLEPIWYLSREGEVLLGGEDAVDDALEASTPRLGRDTDATGHPYQKPLAVLRWLLVKLPAEAVVLDPFLGSGTTLVAARQLGMRAIGIEADEAWCQVAAERVRAQSVLPFTEAASEVADGLFAEGAA